MAKYLIAFLLAGILCFSLLSCGGDQDSKSIPLVENPASLPYRFTKIGSTTQPIHPIVIDSSGNIGGFTIQNNWRDTDTMSSVVFYADSYLEARALTQFNFITSSIRSYRAANLDRDREQELIVSYTYRDTAWTEIVDIKDRQLGRYMLGTGEDINASGHWDGDAFICGAEDINDDGRAEIFYSLFTGYDQLPRQLICLDWFNDKILWNYSQPGFISMNHFNIVHHPESDEIVLIFGAGSHGNGVEIDGIDDSHSYLYCLDANGNLRWRIQAGGVFTHLYPKIYDYDDDGVPEVASNMYYGPHAERKDALYIFNLDGQPLDSIVPERFFFKFDIENIDPDSQPEVILSMDDSMLFVFSHGLQLEKTLRYPTRLRFMAAEDFLGDGSNQILLYSEFEGLLLVDHEFNPLAFHALESKPSSYHSLNSNRAVMIWTRAECNVYKFTSSPWYTVFSRKPWLAFLLGALPIAMLLGLAIYILLKFRQKNRIISEQKEALEETYGKLVEIEKFKQVKDFSGSLTHEIRNALFPIHASLARLEKIQIDDPQQKGRLNSQLETMSASLAKAFEYTDMIAHYIRLEEIHLPEKVVLSEVVQDVIRDNRDRIESEDVEVQVNGPGDTSIRSNRKQFYSVMNNLFLNSLDALREKRNGRIQINWSENSSMVNLDFKDNGAGIPPEQMERIFDAFFSLKKDQGIGLGLAIVKKTVEIYRGKIDVISQPGQGTTFKLKLRKF